VSDPTLLRGGPLADEITERVGEAVSRLRAAGTVPTLGTVMMSDDPVDGRFVDYKHDGCAAVGIDTRRVDLPPDAPAERLYRAVDRLAADEAVTALFVQVPVPDRVDLARVRASVPPAKDVDCFSPARLGAVATGGDGALVPATTAAVRRLLDSYGVGLAGGEVVVVGRNPAVGRPLVADLLSDRTPLDTTVTVCHSRTTDLATKTRRADVLVTAAGVPGLIDGSMLSEGVTVVDVSTNRVPNESAETGYAVVGDVDFGSAKPKADAITPVPGGVGPLTLAGLLRNVVELTAETANSEVSV
jgi:methylenetetrahydrofolate dehydrogenase (NADP+)/methenyltetrahydrofolate cyclohydrolase